jgi:hypothetical protein
MYNILSIHYEIRYDQMYYHREFLVSYKTTQVYTCELLDEML